MITVILIMVPLTVPKAFGVRIYGVLTGSMAPAYSVGGVVYVVEENAQDIVVGDVITYTLGSGSEYVMTHRVVEIADGYFITKGDANNAVDPEPVAFERLIGKAAFFVPGMAGVAEFVNSKTGHYVFIMLFALAFMCWVAADMICPSDKKSKVANKATDKPIAKKKRSGLALQLTGGVLMVGALIYIGTILWGYRESGNEYANLEQEVFGLMEVASAETPEEKADASMPEETQEEEAQVTYSEQELAALAKIQELHEENPEVIGWIAFDNMDISYPIMQAKDNDYYLDHTFSGEENSAGSIFMEASNLPDFEDYHTIIYGHNMKNGSMFGSLKNYKTKDHYKGNEYFTVYTLDSVYRYQIFAYYDISMYGDVYNNQFGPDDFFQSFIDNMVKRSYYDTGVRPVKTDKILTLSTCSTQGNRFVVNAVRIEDE